MDHVVVQHPHDVASADDEQSVQTLSAQAAEPALHARVRPGARTGVRRIRIPSERNTSSKAAVNFASRSRMRKRSGAVRSVNVLMRLRACWVTHYPAPVNRSHTAGSSIRGRSASNAARAYLTL